MLFLYRLRRQRAQHACMLNHCTDQDLYYFILCGLIKCTRDVCNVEIVRLTCVHVHPLFVNLGTYMYLDYSVTLES